MYGVSSITVTEDVALITINKAPVSAGLLADILNEFASAVINIDMITHAAPQGEYTSLSFSIPGSALIPALEITARLTEKYPTVKPLVSSGNCKCQLYGLEMEYTPGVAARALKAVAEARGEITLITTSAVDISILVTHAYSHDVVAALKAEFEL